MNVLIIHEYNQEYNEHDVIGVCDSIENAESLINLYYGEYKEIVFTDIRDSSLEYSKVIELNGLSGDADDVYRVVITLQWFELNHL